MRNPFDAPAAPFDETRVHAQQIRGEERRFVAARARADFEDRRTVIQRITGNKQGQQGLLQGSALGVESLDFGFGLDGKVGLVTIGHLARVGEFQLHFRKPVGFHDDFGEPMMLAPQRGQARRVPYRLRIGEKLFHFGRAAKRLSRALTKMIQHRKTSAGSVM